MKFKKFEELELKKSSMSIVKGGTSTTSYKEVGHSEMEYLDADGDGVLSEEEMAAGGTLVDLPI